MRFFRFKRELVIPPGALSDAHATELIRAWSAHNGVHCTLNIANFGDNERIFWGILLTDVARHVAAALLEQKGWDKNETLQEIRRVFNAELNSPTAELSGGFLT